MKLKNAITLSAVALATAFTFGDLYAQKKKSKTKKVQEETFIGVQRGSNYGDPKDVKAEAGAFAIVPLKYKYFGLEEYIDEETMFIHFSCATMPVDISITICTLQGCHAVAEALKEP